MREQIISLPQATLIAEHIGFAGTLLSQSEEVSGGSGSGGAFSVYHSFTELKDCKHRSENVAPAGRKT